MTVSVDLDRVVCSQPYGRRDGVIADASLAKTLSELRALMERDAVFIRTDLEPEGVMPWLESHGFDTTIDERCSHCARGAGSYRSRECGYCHGDGLLALWQLRGQLLVTNRRLPALREVTV